MSVGSSWCRSCSSEGCSPPSPRDPADTALWDWLTVDGERQPRSAATTARSQLLQPGMTVTHATWTFDRGLPIKVIGPTLNAKTGDIAIEELHIAHEGLRLEAGT